MRVSLLYLFFLALTQIATAQKTVLVEKFSNSHCGNCPNASLIIQDIVDDNPNAIWITHYKPFEGNPLNNEESNQLWFDFNLFGVPSILVDRKYDNGLFTPNNQWRNVIEAKLEEDQIIAIGINNMVTNAFTNELTFDVAIDFFTDVAQGEYRVNYIIVEDMVTGEPQDNYYNNVEGHPHYGLGNEIWNYQHRNVVRHIGDSAWGSQIDELINPDANTSINTSFQYEIPDHFNLDNMFVVVMVSKYNPDNLQDIEVLQASKMQLSEGVITSNENNSEILRLKVIPNPGTNFINVESQINKGKIILYNQIGVEVLCTEVTDQLTSLDISYLPTGNYLLKLTNGESIAEQKVIIVR